jgi:hypothetical protein
LSESETEKEPLQWFWAIGLTNQTWVVDYPPVKLEEYVLKRKAIIEERERKTEELRASLAAALKDLRVNLIPVSEEFIIGAPMLFRLELVNAGRTTVNYQNAGIAHFPLLVFDKNGPLISSQTLAQIAVPPQQLGPGESTFVADQIDLRKHYTITKPGQYVVQFSGEHLQIGHPISGVRPGPFGEQQIERNALGTSFFSLTNRLPSSPVKIKVRAARRF